jgi:Family of unknown function (DUF6152)
MKRNAIHLATAICITVASSASAHHSYGLFYDLCTSVTIEGQVESVQWKNPHVWIDLKTDDGTTYGVEWTGPQNLTRAGLATDALKAGDRVVVTGSPIRDAAQFRAAYPALARLDPMPQVVSALTQIRRMSDSWNWTRAVGPPPECGRR